MANRLITWDFTLGRHLEETKDKAAKDVIEELKGLAKKWVFQGERSAPTALHPEGYIHWQGRVSLWKKKRAPELWALSAKLELMSHAHWSPTSSEVAASFAGATNEAFYIMKEDTRIDGEGPYRDTDTPIFLQRRVLNIMEKGLFAWQQQIIDSKDIIDDRHINVIVDRQGNTGKSTITAYVRQQKMAIAIPAMDVPADYMACVLAKEKLGMYIFDLPRAMPKKNMNAIFSAIEQIKDGYAYDKRYKFRDETFEQPIVWVFSNVLPPLECLSRDRWVFWRIQNEELIQFQPDEVQQPEEVRVKRGASAAGFLSPETLLLAPKAKRTGDISCLSTPGRCTRE